MLPFSHIFHIHTQIVDLVRGGLTSLQRGTLGALVVMDVHARDVVADLAKENIQDVGDFAWQAQLRSYWESTVSLLLIHWSQSRSGFGAWLAIDDWLRTFVRVDILLTDVCQLSMFGSQGSKFTPGQGLEVDFTIRMRMMNSSLEYGYEYLGNSSRLVITPLTVRKECLQIFNLSQMLITVAVKWLALWRHAHSTKHIRELLCF